MIKVQISESGGKNAVPGIRRRAAKAPADNARRTSETETQTGQDKTPSFRIDSFERSPFHMPTELSGITGIELPKEKLKELSGELKLAKFHHHYIDWEDTEASFSENSEISVEDSQLLNHRVNRIAALYVTSKNRIEKEYGEDEEKLAENINRLDALFQKTRRRLTDSYGRTVGSFYENMGNKGIKSRMCESLAREMDRRLDDYEALAERIHLKDNQFYGSWQTSNENDTMLFQSVLEIQERSGTAPAGHSEGEQAEYSLKDLQAAGAAAKLSGQIGQTRLPTTDDYHLGLDMAIHYMKLSSVLQHIGVSRQMSSMILGAFENCLDQHSGMALTQEGDVSKIFNYTVSQYEKTGDLSLAVRKGAAEYIGIDFFLLSLGDNQKVQMAESTRYQFHINNFIRNLRENDSHEIWWLFADQNISAFQMKA